MQFSPRQLLQGAIVAGRLASAFAGRTPPAHAGQTPAIRPRTPTRIVVPQAGRVGDVFRVGRTIPAVNLAPGILMLDHVGFTLARGELGSGAHLASPGETRTRLVLGGS